MVTWSDKFFWCGLSLNLKGCDLVDAPWQNGSLDSPFGFMVPWVNWVLKRLGLAMSCDALRRFYA